MMLNKVESKPFTTFDESVVRAESNEMLSGEYGRCIRPSIDLKLDQTIECAYSIKSQSKFPSSRFVKFFGAVPQILQRREILISKHSIVVNA